MRSSGTASIHELQAGFINPATDAIAANGGVATEALKVAAAMVKVSIQTDQTGKDIVKSMEGAAGVIKTTEDAYHQLGLRTPEELNKIAVANAAAWDKIKGDTSLSTEALKTAFTRYAQSAVDAFGSVDNELYLEKKAVLETEAAVAGLSITFDKNGKIAVKSQSEAADGFGKTARAVDDVTGALERQNVALEATISAQEKANNLAERKKALDDKARGIDSQGFAVDSTGKRIESTMTQFMMPVHLYGHPCDLDPLLEICRRWPLAMVEDATESLGARYRGRAVGADGSSGCLSFNGNKIITTGGGGMVLTRDAAMAARVRALSTRRAATRSSSSTTRSASTTG